MTSFSQWLNTHGYDQQHWSSEMLNSLQRRFELEQRIGCEPEADALRDLVELVSVARSAGRLRIVADCRSCSWPSRVYRI